MFRPYELTAYKLTDESLAALRDEKLPESVLEKLAELKDERFVDLRDLRCRLELYMVSPIEVESYQDLIMKHAVQIVIVVTREERQLEGFACLGSVSYLLFFIFLR
jgi:hypothetical protein